MSRWWRAHDEAVDDPKLQMLSDRLFRAWFNICCITSQNGGRLPAIEAVAFKLRTTPAKAAKVIEELRAAVLVDETDGALAPHNWNARQFKTDGKDTTGAARQQRYRDRKSNGKDNVTRNVTVTPTRDRAETEQISEPRGSGALAPSDPKTEYFKRGRQVLGQSSGGQLSKLLKSFGNEDDPKAIAKARARIEDASTKAKPAEWIGRVMRGPAQITNAEGLPFPEGIT